MHTSAAPTRYVEDVNGAHRLDFDMESGGPADFYIGGHHLAGHWSAPDRNSPYTFNLDVGATLSLPGGLTFVDVVTR